MLRDRLLGLLGARSSLRARSHVHGRLPVRAVFHLLLIGMAALAALLTAHLVTDAEPAPVSHIPPVPLSGVRAIAPTGEAFLRPGVSHETLASPLRASLASFAASLRPTGNVETDDTLSDEVADVYAASQDSGYENRPLAEIIDPTRPYELYTVRGGDTLLAIALTYDTTVDNILLNNAEVVDAGSIPVGQQILVPLGEVEGILYKVGHGDTIARVVSRFLYVTVQDVIDHRPNNLYGGRSLLVGEYILLPGAEPPVQTPEGYVIGPPPPVSASRFGLPVAGWSFISDPFGTDRGGGRIHTGIDLAFGGVTAASSIYASCDGWVSRVEWLTWSYGYYVIVDCGGGWETLYAHFREIIVHRGQHVTKGETVLGISGSTGYSTGEHLHFEIRYNGQYLNPADYIHFPYSRAP